MCYPSMMARKRPSPPVAVLLGLVAASCGSEAERGTAVDGAASDADLRDVSVSGDDATSGDALRPLDAAEIDGEAATVAADATQPSEAATPDGSVDVADTVEAGKADGPGEAATPQQPQILAGPYRAPAGIAVDATSVYVALYGESRIVKIPLAGVSDGGQEVTIASQQSQPNRVAVDGSNVYWTLYRAPLAGLPDAGSPFLVGSSAKPWNLALDGDNVFWTDVSYGQSNGTVFRSLRTGLPEGGPLVVAPGAAASYGVAVRGGYVYWADSLGGRVLRASPDGSTQTELVRGEGTVYFVAVNDTTVYWTTDTEVRSAPAGGLPDGGAAHVVATGQKRPWSIALDATSIYFTTVGGAQTMDGTVARCPLAGCPGGVTKPLADHLDHPDGIALDDSSIYWTNGGDGQLDGMVMKLVKPFP